MPGNPLPKLIMSAARWPYDRSAATGEKFGQVSLSQSPKAVFDASEGIPPNQAFGYVQFNAGTSLEAIPDSGGLVGVKRTYVAKDMFSDSGVNEINYKLLVPQSHVWEKIKVWQPSNYRCPREMYFEIDSSIDSIATWEIGDELQSGGNTGIVEAFDGDNTVGVRNYTGHPELNWGSGDSITNLTKELTVTSTKGAAKAGIGKFMSLWTSDDPTREDRGYSNSGIFMGLRSDIDFSAPDESGSSFAEVTTTTSDAGLPTEKRTGQTSNEVGGHPKIFDTYDNGSVVEFFMERKRSSAFGVSDGLVRVWKKTSKVGSGYESWKLVYQDLSVNIFSSFNDNKWTHGYLLGNKNGTYRVDIDLHLLRYELWLSKPEFLPETV